ncbi:hypothetical protein [Simkania sp.]|uniref:hypothetical protein n=1 Tax=Simkania sp. TaxID=34094 RepID=UPI003B525C94
MTLDLLKTSAGYTTWDTDKKPPALTHDATPDYHALYQYLIGAEEASTLANEGLYAYISLPDIPATITDPAKKIEYLQDQALQHYAYYKLTNDTTHAIALPLAVSPSADDFEAARKWLKDPHSTLTEGAKKGILFAHDKGMSLDNPSDLQEIEKTLRVLEQEQRDPPDSFGAHTPSKEDINAVLAFLDGRSAGPLTENQRKTFKQMQAKALSETTPPVTAAKAKYYHDKAVEMRFEQVTRDVDVTGWTPQLEHFEGAQLWLQSASHTEPSEDVKKALASLHIDRDNSLTKAERRLKTALRALGLEKENKPVNTDSHNPSAADYTAVFDYIAGTTAGPLNEDQLKTFKQLQDGAPTTLAKKLDYYGENLNAGKRILQLEAAPAPMNFDTHTPTADHYEAVLTYIADPSAAPLTDADHLKTFAQLKANTPGTPKEKIEYYRRSLNVGMNALRLEANPIADADSYTPTQEDVVAVAKFLDGSSTAPLTDNQRKTFEKLKANTPGTPQEKVEYYSKNIRLTSPDYAAAITAVERDHSGTNWAAVWANVDGVKSFDLSTVNPTSVKKSDFESALRKLKAGQTLNNKEKYAAKYVYDMVEPRLRNGDTNQIKGYIFAVFFARTTANVAA